MSRKSLNYLLLALVIIVILKVFGVGRLMLMLQKSNQQVDHSAIGGANLKQQPSGN